MREDSARRREPETTGYSNDGAHTCCEETLLTMYYI
jgi:hypothetical protein